MRFRTLRARAEDQAGEIARLKAALAAFEQTDGSGGLKNSKLALKARAGSAEAQAERQTATISRLRAELAAANERLARQAAHFMDEMRRDRRRYALQRQTRSAARDTERRKLVERVAQVRPALAAEKPKPPPGPAGAERGTEWRRKGGRQRPCCKNRSRARKKRPPRHRLLHPRPQRCPKQQRYLRSGASRACSTGSPAWPRTDFGASEKPPDGGQGWMEPVRYCDVGCAIAAGYWRRGERPAARGRARTSMTPA